MPSTNSSRKTDLGQTLYTEWLKTVNGFQNSTEKERREVFKMVAQYAFEAAEEFAKVFRNQEDN